MRIVVHSKFQFHIKLCSKMTKFQYRMSSEHLMYDDDDGRTVHLRAPFPALQVVYVIVVFAADDDYY